MFYHALTFAGSRGCCLDTRVQTSSQDPASVNAMNQTCAIVVLAFLSDFNVNCAENVS